MAPRKRKQNNKGQFAHSLNNKRLTKIFTGKFLCFNFNKNNENTFTDFLFSRQSVGVDGVCPQTSLRHLPSTPTDAFHALKSV
ncbi:MAG: hypothetical protein II752_05745, partial [Muribaculaceae bacterium]|nr:hypothetical protein [Muribaculaceae bacterium]